MENELYRSEHETGPPHSINVSAWRWRSGQVLERTPFFSSVKPSLSAHLTNSSSSYSVASFAAKIKPAPASLLTSCLPQCVDRSSRKDVSFNSPFIDFDMVLF